MRNTNLNIESWGYFKYATGEEILDIISEVKGNSGIEMVIGKDENEDMFISVKLNKYEYSIYPERKYNLKDTFSIMSDLATEILRSEYGSGNLFTLKGALLVNNFMERILSKYKFQSKKTKEFMESITPDFDLLEDFLERIPDEGMEICLNVITNTITISILNKCLVELGYENEIVVEDLDDNKARIVEARIL